jgi:hypothetical protein
MSDASSKGEDKTREMLSVDQAEQILDSLAEGTFSDDDAAEAGVRALAGLSATMGVPKMTDLCVIQYGREAKRAEEPAHITGRFTSCNPHARGRPGFFAVVKFDDDELDWVDMTWHVYEYGDRPPWLLSHDVTIDEEDDEGNTTTRVLQTNRPEDRRGWLVFIPAKDCRRSLKVREGYKG